VSTVDPRDPDHDRILVLAGAMFGAVAVMALVLVRVSLGGCP